MELESVQEEDITAEQKIEKRNGDMVSYDKSKIKSAIYRAMVEIDCENPDMKSRKAASAVQMELITDYFIKDKIPTVEDIQDIVEDVLIELNYKETAKAYIRYRDMRNKNRIKADEERKLTDSFISDFKHSPDPFNTELGKFIYYRTYSRWLNDKNRREDWWETVRRAVEYNTSLAPTTKKEAKELYKNIYEHKNFLAGRTLYSGGTKVSKLYSMQNYNCSFTTIEDTEDFTELFLLLMLGYFIALYHRNMVCNFC